MDCLSHLVEMIIGSFPVQDPHPEKTQESQIVNPHPIHYLEPLNSVDHMCPQLVIKEEVREDIIPPAMVCSLCILPLFDDSMEGILGNLENPPQCFFKQK